MPTVSGVIVQVRFSLCQGDLVGDCQLRAFYHSLFSLMAAQELVDRTGEQDIPMYVATGVKNGLNLPAMFSPRDLFEETSEFSVTLKFMSIERDVRACPDSILEIISDREIELRTRTRSNN